MAAKTKRTPGYCVQKARQGSNASDRAYVELNGKRIYLGVAGSPESHAEYARVLMEWKANGSVFLRPDEKSLLTVNQLGAMYWADMKRYYAKRDGTTSAGLEDVRYALRPVMKLYGDTPASEFGPRKLEAIQHALMKGDPEGDWSAVCRRVINARTRGIVRMFRWGVRKELIPPSVAHGLEAVEGLRAGHSEAKESEPVRPVAMAIVNVVRPLVSKQVKAIIDLQLLTGARPGELVGLTAADIDRSDEIWEYRPKHHKTAHHRHERIIWFIKAAQDILTPYIEGRDPTVPLFSPAEAERDRRAVMHAKRKTPLDQGNRPGTNKSDSPKRPAKQAYTVASYRRAIERGTTKAFPVPDQLPMGDTPEKWVERHRWHPHQLRHNAATFLRKEFGLDVAQTVLGHASGSSVTAIYAERDHEQAKKAMSRLEQLVA